MKYVKMFNVVKEHLGDEVAAIALIVSGINVTLDPTEEECTKSGIYSLRLLGLWKHILWEVPDDILLSSVKAWIAYTDYDTLVSLGGLGGSVAKDFMTIYDNPDTYKGWDLPE